MRVLEIARSYLGVRYAHLGRDRNGLDCVGLIVVVARELGVEFDDFLGYGRQSKDASMLTHFERVADRVLVSDAAIGDILLLSERRWPGHCGFLGPGTLVHSSITRRRVVEEPLSSVPGSVVGAFRVRI